MQESVTVKIFKKQAQALKYLDAKDTEVNEVLYGGGARGGKSWLGCLWQILRRVQMAGSVGVIAREESVRLKTTTLVTFFKVLKALGLRDYVNYSETHKIATFANGSQIFFFDLKLKPSDPEFDRIGSLEITDAFLDEAQQISEKAISVLRGRFSLLSGTNPDGTRWHTIPKALYTCNPRRNWIYNDFVKPAKEGTLRKTRRFVKSLPTDNPHLDKAYIDNLLQADPITVQRLYFGNFEYDDDPATLCDYDAINDLFYNEHIPEMGMPTCSADIAGKGRDRFVVLSAKGNVIRIPVDLVYSPGKVVEEQLKSAMIRDSVPRSYTIVDADGMGSFLESYLNGIKEFHGGFPPIDKQYATIKAQCAFKLAELINKRALRIVCTNEQRERIMDELGALKQAYIDRDTNRLDIIKKETMKVILGHSPDYLDALIMLMYFRVVATAGSGMEIRTTSYSND